MKNILIVKLKSYQGGDTALTVFPEPLYMVIDAKTGEELDNGYRSYEEAIEAWGDQNIINEEGEK